MPAPFGPTRATTRPAGIASVQSCRAHVRPYRLPSPLVSIAFMRPTSVLPAGALMQRVIEQCPDALLLQPGQRCRVQPLDQPGPQRLPVPQRNHFESALDVRPLAGATGSEPLVLELAVGLQHGVGVDRERPDHLLDRRQPVTRREETEPQRVLHLPDQLLVGRHARGRVEPELDGHTLRLFIYLHR